MKKMKALTYNINTQQSIQLEQTETLVATVLLGSPQASCTLRRDIYDVPYDKPNSNSSKGEERSLQAEIIQDQSRLPENYVNLEQLTPKVGNADNSQSNVSLQSKSGLKPANLILPQDFRCNNDCPPEIKDLTCKVDPPLIRAGVTEETSSNDVSAEINLCADHEHGDMDRSFGSDYASYDDPPKSNSSEVTGHMDASDDFHRGPLQAGLKGSSVGVHPTESEYEVRGLYQGLMCVEHNYLALYNIPCKKWSKENLQTLGVSSKTKKLPPRLLKVRTPNQNEIESRAKVIREDLKVTDTCTNQSLRSIGGAETFRPVQQQQSDQVKTEDLPGLSVVGMESTLTHTAASEVSDAACVAQGCDYVNVMKGGCDLEQNYTAVFQSTSKRPIAEMRINVSETLEVAQVYHNL